MPDPTPTRLPMNRTATIACATLVAFSLPLSAQPAASASGAAAASSFSFRHYTAPVPPDWQPVPPSSGFRVAQYRAPGAAAAGDGEVIVFFFGRGQGGSAAANIERWASQFSGPDGAAVRPRVETGVVHGMPVTTAELSGSYARGIGAGPVGAARQGQTLRAAVLESPDGNVIFQLHGDSGTVEHHRAGFDAMVRGFAPR